jgi:hypothetical protein
VHGEHSSCEVDGDEAEVSKSSSCLPAAISTATQQCNGYFGIEVGDMEEKLTERNVDGTGKCPRGNFLLLANVDEDSASVDDLAPSKDVNFRRWGSFGVAHET